MSLCISNRTYLEFDSNHLLKCTIHIGPIGWDQKEVKKQTMHGSF